MAAADRFVEPYFVPVDGNGLTLPGAKLEFFVTGTSTHQNTYSDAALTTPNANPLTADGAGRFPTIFMLQTPYKVVLNRADTTNVWTADPVQVASAAIDAANIALVNAALAAAKVAAAAAISAEGRAEAAQLAAEAAKQAAADSAASIDVTVINNRLTADEAAIATLSGDMLTIATAFNSARITYPNIGAMNADLVPTAGAIATLIDTGVQYIKVGGTGTGSWALYPGDRYTALESRVSALDTPTYLANMSAGAEAVVVRNKMLAAVDATYAPYVSTTFSGTTVKCQRLLGLLTSYNTFQGCLLKRTNLLANQALTVTTSYVHHFSGTPAGVAGIGLVLSPILTGSVVSGHTLMGNAVYPAAGSSLFLVWRENGAIVAYDGFDGAQGGNLVTTVGGSASTGFRWVQGDTMSFIARFSSDASRIQFYCYRNGLLLGSVEFHNLPANWYVGPAVRFGDGSVAEGSEIDVSVAQLDRLTTDLITYYLDPAAAGGGNGTRDRRFNSISDASIRMLQTGSRWEVVLAGGDYRSGTFEFSAADTQGLRVISETGRDATIYGSTHLAAAGGNWTQHDAATYPNVWSRNWFYKGQAPINESGAIIELGVPSIRSGVTVLPYHLPRRYSISFTGTDAAGWAAVNAFPSSHYISVATGKIYFHATGSANPNTKDYELSDRDSCIALHGDLGNLTASYSAELYISGVKAKHAFASNVWADRCRIYYENVASLGSGGANGFALNDSTGTVTNCVAEGNANDGFNNTNIYGEAISVPHPAMIAFFNPVGRYNGWTELAPFTDGRHYGDGTSTHTWGAFYDWGGDYYGNGKCGSAHAAANYRGWGVRCSGNLTANFQATTASIGFVTAYDLFDAISEDSPIGFACQLSTPGTNSVQTMTIEGAKARNCTVLFAVENTGIAPATSQLRYSDVYSRGHTTKYSILGTGVLTHIVEGALIDGT